MYYPLLAQEGDIFVSFVNRLKTINPKLLNNTYSKYAIITCSDDKKEDEKTIKLLEKLDMKYNFSGLNSFNDYSVDKLSDKSLNNDNGHINEGNIVKDKTLTKYADSDYHSASTLAKQERAATIKSYIQSEQGQGHVGLDFYDYGMSMAPRFLPDEANGITGERTRGFYDPNTNSIYINKGVVDTDGIMTLYTIAHLMRHAYQVEHAEKGSAIFKSLLKENYSDPEVDHDNYLNNPAEIDAHLFAQYFVNRALLAYDYLLNNPDSISIEPLIEEFEDPSTMFVR